MACADRTLSVKKAQGFASLITDAHIDVPAMNKYTKVDPVERQLCLLLNFFGLMPRAIAAKAGRKSSSGVSPSDQDPGAAVGAPQDEVAHLRKIGRLKLHTAHDFLSKPSSSWKTLMWVAV